MQKACQKVLLTNVTNSKEKVKMLEERKSELVTRKLKKKKKVS